MTTYLILDYLKTVVIFDKFDSVVGSTIKLSYYIEKQNELEK